MAKAAAAHSDCGGSIVVGDAEVLPLPDGMADCAIAFMSLQDVDEMELAVAEAARVLSAGPRFVVAITTSVEHRRAVHSGTR
jgi:ubiquinone/menaquinone biosynthesis C-methylase UbiE